jgi:hypothetical protein
MSETDIIDFIISRTWSGATSTRDSARIHRVASSHSMALNTAIGIDKLMMGTITAEPTWARGDHRGADPPRRPGRVTAPPLATGMHLAVEQ